MSSRVFEYIVKVDCEKSFTLSFEGQATEAILYSNGNPLDRVNISNQTEGRLKFFNGIPLHGGLVNHNGFEVHFLTTNESAPKVSVHENANSLTWDDLRIPNRDDYYVEEVVMTQPYRREKNILIYSGYMGSGYALMKYSY